MLCFIIIILCLILHVSFISKNEITLFNNIESITPEKENKIKKSKEDKNNIEIENNQEIEIIPEKSIVENSINKIENLNSEIDEQRKINENLEKDNKKKQNIIEQLKEQIQKLNNDLKEKEKEIEFINNKDLLNEKEKEKLEELEKEIYKKDLFIRNKLLEMNDLRNQIDNLNLDKIEIEKELNNYKQLLEEKNHRINLN